MLNLATQSQSHSTKLRVNQMKFLAAAAYLTAGIAAAEVSVYHLNDLAKSPYPRTVPAQEALMYFSDKFNLDAFSLNDYNPEEVIDFLNYENKVNPPSDRPKLIVQLTGVNFSEQASFQIDDGKVFWSQFEKLVSSDFQAKPVQITDNIRAIAINKDVQTLKTHFNHFNAKIQMVWDNLKQNFFSSELNYVNDKFYINEISQLAHLDEYDFDLKDVVFVTLNSLYSMSNLIGAESATYKSGEKILNELLKLHQFDVLLIDNALPSHIAQKRQELDKVFRDNKKIASGGCFDSEESCQVGTSNCNSHGLCSKQSKGCWTCVCSASYDKKASKTTNWSGFDCSKKNISNTANLLLWSSVTLLALFVGGVKLLVSVGNEPLPAVLDAST